MSHFDVIVIGGGAPGEHCAGALADGGCMVAVVERELVGGECSYYACIPSKVLLRPGEAVHAANEATGHAQVDVRAALAWRDFMVSNYSDAGQERWLKNHHITLLRGYGKLKGRGRVDVDGVEHTADHVILATGADATLPDIPGLARLPGVWTSREATGMKRIPRRLIVLGGGPVAVELAQVVRRLGGEAVIVEAGPHLLTHEARTLGVALGEVLGIEGIEVLLNSHANSAQFDGEQYELAINGSHTVLGDQLLIATGRKPRVENLGLETVGVEVNPHGISVDSRLRAGENLWAIGDVTGIAQLTHVGKYQGRVVAANILGESREAHYEAIPRVTFTDPQCAAVGALQGKYEGTAKLVEVAKTATYRRAYRSSKGFLTLLSDGKRLTGAYALGPEAGEWLQQATLAIRAQVSLSLLEDTIQPFPTFSEIFHASLKELKRNMRTV